MHQGLIDLPRPYRSLRELSGELNLTPTRPVNLTPVLALRAGSVLNLTYVYDLLHTSSDLGSIMPASTPFPRPVFDEFGTYTVDEAGAYEVIAPSVQRYHEMVFAIRDLRSAHEMVEQCCREDLDEIHPLLEQSLWVGAVILYSKPFTRN